MSGESPQRRPEPDSGRTVPAAPGQALAGQHLDPARLQGQAERGGQPESLVVADQGVAMLAPGRGDPTPHPGHAQLGGSPPDRAEPLGVQSQRRASIGGPAQLGERLGPQRPEHGDARLERIEDGVHVLGGLQQGG
jgi:hypothetical protein